MRIRRLLLCLTTILLPVMVRAQSPSPPLTMSVDSPLSRVAPADVPSSGKAGRALAIMARFGRWFPVAVTLDNTGEAVQGTLEMRLTANAAGEGGAVTTFQTQVDLPANSRKRVWLYGRIERGESDGGVVSFNGRGINVPPFGFSLISPAEGARIVLTISDSDQRLNFLGGLLLLRDKLPKDSNAANAANALNNSRAAETLGASHQWVPSRWIGLDGIDLVVLQDFPHTSLLPEQLDALRGYVAGGGTLLAIGGANWQRLSQSPLKTLWPVAPVGSQSATAEEVASLVKANVKLVRNGADRLGGAPVVVARGALAKGTRALGPTMAKTLACWRSYGAGRVLWLAFDPTQPPFIGWSGQERLWAKIFARHARAARLQDVDARLETLGDVAGNNYGGYNGSYGNYDNQFSQPPPLETTLGLRSALVRSPQMRTPSSSTIAWFLALYVFFLVPVNYAILRAVDRREWAWITVPMIVVAFSFLAYLAAARLHGTQIRQRHVNIVQGSNDGALARADAMLWLFSPRKTTYEIRGRDAEGRDLPSMALAPFADGQRSDTLDYSLVQQPDSGTMSIEAAPINMWDYKTFVGHAIVNSGKGVSWTRGKEISVTNNTPFDWRGAVWIESGMVRKLGDVKSGATASIKASIASGDREVFNDAPFTSDNLASAITQYTDINSIFPFDNNNTSINIARAALQVALREPSLPSGGPLLLAWGNRAPARIEAQNTGDTSQDISLFMWKLDQ